MATIISPCNGLSRCFRHPTGCAKIVVDPRVEYAARQRRKARRRRLWNIIRKQYQIGRKWGLDPIPPQYHLQAVLLMERVRDETELIERLREEDRKRLSATPSSHDCGSNCTRSA